MAEVTSGRVELSTLQTLVLVALTNIHGTFAQYPVTL